MKKLAIACAMLVASVTASVACDGGCAVVLKASDGYWNLRATPSGRILLRLYRGDTVECSRLPVPGPKLRCIIATSSDG
jgi:hypothetical protein